MNICFYISDYGYGHASRSIAIIRKLLGEYKDAKIYIKNSGAFDFIRNSLPGENVEVVQSKNDIGVICRENSISVDREQTRKMLIDWISSWDEFIKKEKQFCESHTIDLILSDITPQAFVVAKEFDIPGNAIERMGIGRIISQRSFLAGEWKHELHDLNKYILNFDKMDDRIKSDGTKEIINYINEDFK